ncbi:hypothetical protein Pcinc_040927 [Petrolisthes cinctipes]|uniref:Uncharacterized protein n=1 Tax=Petrolisthes cinctipes TaxID=88211 RepID=A0AAE1BPD1_PETCI|nr:hypothetical protein Pcinc_040927 [Petrolisthes cinctipes]
MLVCLFALIGVKRIEERECNYPPVFRRWFTAQSEEIARRCVQPPARLNPKDPPFVLRPSLEPVVAFLIDEAHRYVKMDCKVCNERAFPNDPQLRTDQGSTLLPPATWFGPRRIWQQLQVEGGGC